MASRDELLHKLHDGELSAADADALLATLDDAEREKLAALDELGTLVRGAAEADGAEHGGGLDLWASLEQALPAAGVAAAAAAAASAGDVANVRSIHSARRRGMFRATAVMSALAVAAAALLWLRPVPKARPSNACDVEDLEVAGQSATVIAIPDDRGDGRGDDTTLIWFDHEETDQWESL